VGGGEAAAIMLHNSPSEEKIRNMQTIFNQQERGNWDKFSENPRD
jgi:hypothetical protein